MQVFGQSIVSLNDDLRGAIEGANLMNCFN